MRAGPSGCFLEEILLHAEPSAGSHLSRWRPGSLKARQQDLQHDICRLLIQTRTAAETRKRILCLQFTFFGVVWLPEDELEVRACRMESACRVAIILSISSACCSRPTSSRASSAVKQMRQRLGGKMSKCLFKEVKTSSETKPRLTL